MKRYIFESRIPSLLTPDALRLRADAWIAAGFDTVVLQVDDGHGSTWPTTGWATDPRSKAGETQTAIDYLHSRGLSVIADVALANFLDGQSPHANLRLQNFAWPFYSFWSQEFRDRRLQCLVDLANSCDVDGIALDYLRTGREAMGGEVPAIGLLTSWLVSVRTAVSPGMSLIGVHAAPFASLNQQGIDLKAWLVNGSLDADMLFDYAETFPTASLLSLIAYVGSKKLWPLIGNYSFTNNQAASLSGLSVSKNWRQVQRQLNPGAMGVYLANLLTPEQCVSIAYTQKGL